tara:strand:+ start:20 stop:2842 length:2823 start_codon:yes stop_codon:yes gene_type:complete
MAIITDLQVFYPLRATVDDVFNRDNGTNSGISFGTHGGVVSGDYTAPDKFTVPNSTFNFSFGTGDLTFSCWVNPDTTFYGASAQGTLLGADYQNYELAIYEGEVQIYLGGAANFVRTNAGNSVVTGSWQHIVVTRTGGTVTIYVNNATPSQTTGGTPGTANATSSGTPVFCSGERNATSNNHYDGKLSDIVMWKRALSATEIGQIYAAGAGNFSSLLPINASLLHWFPLKADGADSVGSASPNVSNVTFTGSHATFTAATNSYIHWDNIFNVGTSELTMAGWVYANSYAGSGHQGAVLSKACSSLNNQTGNALQFHNSNSLAQIGSGGTKTEASAALPTTGAWHHIAMTRDGTSIKLYHDGVLVDTQTSASVYNITSAASNTFLTCGAIRIPGSAYWYGGLDGNLNDLLAYTRALSATEIASIHSAGQGNFSSLMSSTNATLRGQIGSVIHRVTPQFLKLEGQIGSVTHTAPASLLKLEGQFGSVVHPPETTTAVCPDISGSVGVPATFNGSASTAVTYYHWSWVSVPGGSTIANAPIAFPDNGATAPIDMTGNLGLWHFETINTVSVPTGSIGLRDTFGDGWHGNNFVSVSVNGATVLNNITLPSGSGPLWFDYPANNGDSVSVTFTAGTYPTECKYDLNDAAGGTGTTFYNSPTNPSTYNFTAGTFSPATSYNTPDTSGGGRNFTVNGATQATGKVGSHSLDFDGTNDYLLYEAADVFPGTTNAITISFWQNGTAGLGNNSIIWAEDGSGNRVVNIHMPYIGRIYFDCGNTGASYDRIDKAATAGEYSGSWSHWVFTKDVSAGEMKIYRNGALWHSGGSNTKTLSTITKLTVGSAQGTSGFYNGEIDELAVFSRVLSADEVAEIYSAQNGAFAGMASTLTFTPDLVGTYTINLAVSGSVNTNADAVISVPSSGGGGLPGQGGSLQGNILQGFSTEGLI